MTCAPGRTGVDYFLIVALLVVAGSVVWSQLGGQVDSNPATADISTVDKSIAVLPFVDMSPGGDQEYFGDGIAEELLNQLANLEGLRVAGRTSSFAYKGRNEDLRTIGEALDVSLILEGSVRKDGSRIRITAQLINALDGYHFWSETYDRDLTDIFAIQDEIAETVAGILGVRLGVGDVNAFRGAGTDSVEAYEAFLQATMYSTTADERIRQLERVVQMDPDYAAALADLGLRIVATMWNNPPEKAPELLDRGIPILLRAVEVQPESAYAYTLLAAANYARLDWIESEEYHRRSLEIDRTGRGLANHGHMLMRAGRTESAMRLYDSATSADKFPWRATRLTLNAYLSLERYAEFSEYLSTFSPSVQQNLEFLLAVNREDSSELRAAISKLPQSSPFMIEMGTDLLPLLDDPDQALALLRSVFENSAVTWPAKYHDIALLAAFFGDPELALEVFSIEARLTTIRMGMLWYPVMRDARKLPDFKTLVTDINLVDYWRAYGWSSHCRPLQDGDFECY